MRWFELLLSIW